MRPKTSSSVRMGAAMASACALALTPVAAATEVHALPVALPAAAYDVRLAADPVPIGAIPLAFLNNQLTFCGLICPSIAQLLVTVPLGVLSAPVAFIGGLQSGSLLKAIGAAAESVTSPADIATSGIINPDVFIVVPKALLSTLEISVVQGLNVVMSLANPGQFLPTVETAREKILQALNEPATNPPSTLPVGAQGIIQVAAANLVNVAVVVAFQSGELLLAGAVHTANVVATELANTGNIGDALAAGVTAASASLAQAGGLAADAINTAVKEIGAAAHQVSPLTAKAPPTSTAQELTAKAPSSVAQPTNPVQSLISATVTPKTTTGTAPLTLGNRKVPGVGAGQASVNSNAGPVAAAVKSAVGDIGRIGHHPDGKTSDTGAKHQK
jgi:hypothetical protein